MERRTWPQGLRGVKLSIIALGILSASFLSSVIHSRPASAESFLQRTVGCVTDILALKSCAKPTVSPVTSASSSNGQGATPATPANSSSPTTSSSAATSSKPASYGDIANSVEQTPLSTDTVRPADTPPALPVDVQGLASYGPILSAAYATKTFGHMTADTTHTQAILQPSEEGWRLFGVAWYWWLMAIAAITAAAIVVKKIRIRSKQTLSLVK